MRALKSALFAGRLILTLTAAAFDCDAEWAPVAVLLTRAITCRHARRLHLPCPCLVGRKARLPCAEQTRTGAAQVSGEFQHAGVTCARIQALRSAPGLATTRRRRLCDPLRFDAEPHTAHDDALRARGRRARVRLGPRYTPSPPSCHARIRGGPRARTCSALLAASALCASRAEANSTKAKPLSLRQCTLRTLPCCANAALSASASALGGTAET